MPNRKRAVVVSTRVLPRERALLRALAEAEATSVCEVLHRLLIPAAKMRLAQVTTDIGSPTESLIEHAVQFPVPWAKEKKRDHEVQATLDNLERLAKAWRMNAGQTEEAARLIERLLE